MQITVMKFKNSKNFYLNYTDPVTGKRVFEPTRSTDPQVAERMKAELLAKFTLDQYETREQREVKIDALYEAQIERFRLKFPGQVGHAESRWRIRMQAKFARIEASKLTGKYLDNYRMWAQGLPCKAFAKPIEEPVSKATVNRDIALLSAMYTTALEQNVITKIPVTFNYDEEKTTARDGFIEQWQYDKMQAVAAELWVKAFLACTYNFGFRHQETLNLKVHQFDPLTNRLNLRAKDTKTKKPRYAVLTGTDALPFIQELCTGKDGDDYIFTRGSGRNSDGKIHSARYAWADLIEASGVTCAAGAEQAVIVHDMRRSAVRNMVRRGIPESIAMLISGHNTRAVFERYNIDCEQDYIDAAEKIAAGAQAERERAAAVRAVRVSNSGVAKGVARAVNENVTVREVLELPSRAKVQSGLKRVK
jgi:integrase